MRSKKENIKAISFGDDSITLHFSDGRKISTPLAFYPRLLQATPKQRAQWELIGANRGIRWPLVDEDLTIEGIMHGIPSIEYRRPRNTPGSRTPQRKTKA